MYSDLTLEKAKVIRQKEAIKEQTQQLHPTDHTSMDEEVRNPRQHWSKNAINCHTFRTYRDARYRGAVQDDKQAITLYTVWENKA